MWRETIGLHTCDERSNKSLIAKTYRECASLETGSWRAAS